VWQEKI